MRIVLRKIYSILKFCLPHSQVFKCHTTKMVFPTHKKKDKKKKDTLSQVPNLYKA